MALVMERSAITPHGLCCVDCHLKTNLFVVWFVASSLTEKVKSWVGRTGDSSDRSKPIPVRRTRSIPSVTESLQR